MIGPILIVALLLRAATGHGREIACEPQTCTPRMEAAHSHQLAAVPVDLGPHYDRRNRLAVNP